MRCMEIHCYVTFSLYLAALLLDVQFAIQLIDYYFDNKLSSMHDEMNKFKF